MPSASPLPGSVVDSAPPGAPEAVIALELLSIPALLLTLEDDGAFRFDATNDVFDQTDLGRRSGASLLVDELGGRISTFLQSDERRIEFAWRLGDSVDSRQYRVTLARVAVAEPQCLVTLVDQTSELRTEHSLRREMTNDSLTGLPNRAGFTDRLETAIDQNRRSYAVMMVDLNRFSRINACMGSLTGDELLISVARRLKGALRSRDVLARVGGDEFGILLKIDDGPGDADHVAKRIAAALAQPFRLTDFEIRVSCSIGIAFGGDEIGDAEAMIRHAQFAMKRAKTSGRTEAYQTQAFDQLRHQFAMETALRRAIDAGALRLEFQPIYDLATGRIYAFESLTRWTDDGRAIAPDEFIPVAEESGLIVPLGRWAIGEAVRTLAAWDARAGGDCGVQMAVNLSAIQLQRDTVASIVERTLAGYRVAGNRLKLELTESALISDPDRIASTLTALKALGATIAMDDFGTGYSNLAYLQRLPIDILKIDRSFVTGMLADRDKVAIVRAIMGLAQALGMRTVAEGIETGELSQTLAALGCSYGQGFFYARSLPADDAYALLVSRNA